MQWYEWVMVVVSVGAVFGVMWYGQRYLRSVAHYVAGGRVAGRYLLTTAGGEASHSVSQVIATYEQIYQSGWVPHWWQTMFAPLTLLPGLLGFVTYRFRQTKAMTMAQFYEMRYSRRFRLFSGYMNFGGGLLAGILGPVVQARLFVYLLGLPETFHLGGWVVSTYLAILTLYMAGALLLVISGGAITLLTTDCLEGMISNFLYCVITVGLLCLFTWGQISYAVNQKDETFMKADSVPRMVYGMDGGESIMDPFHAWKIKDFNLAFVLIMYSMSIYYSGGGGPAAKSAHEARMAGILGNWRDFSRRAMISFLALCCLTFLLHPDFAAARAPLAEALHHPNLEGNPALQKQVRMPMALSLLLPAGLKGVFAVIMVWALLASTASVIQGRANLFVQDCILPWLKKPLSQAAHIRLLRWIAVAMAVLMCVLSVGIRVTDYLIMWGILAAAIYSAGAGSATIGGLYTRWGTAAGAWTAMLGGAVISFGAMVYKQLFPAPGGGTFFGYHLPPLTLNGQLIAGIACLTCIGSYIVVSLLTCRERCNLDKLLHRGDYAEGPAEVKPLRSRFSLAAILNFNASFTRGDKFITAGIFLFNMTWAGFLVVGTVWNLWRPMCGWVGLQGTALDCIPQWTHRGFMTYWFVALVAMPFTIGIFTTIWFTWGGTRDLRDFFRQLKAQAVDVTDDGTVRKEEKAVEVGR